MKQPEGKYNCLPKSEVMLQAEETLLTTRSRTGQLGGKIKLCPFCLILGIIFVTKNIHMMELSIRHSSYGFKSELAAHFLE